MNPPSPTDRERVTRLFAVSETSDKEPPYRCLPPPSEEWVKRKIKRVLTAFSDIRAEQEAKLKCSWCGGTDLVCGKGHIKATDELKKQVRDAEAKLKEATDGWFRSQHFQDIFKLYEAVVEAAKEFIEYSDNGHPSHCDLWPNPPKSNKCTCGSEFVLNAELKLQNALDALESTK